MSPPIHIVHFVDWSFGSAHFESVARYLDRGVVRSTFLSIASPGGLQDIAARHGHVGAVLNVQPALTSVPLAAYRLRAFLDSNRGAIVHSHTYLAGLTAALGCGSRNRHMYTRHHLRPPPGMTRPIYDEIDRVTAKRAQLVVACAEAVKRILVRVNGIAQDHIRVIHNGIEPLAESVEPAPIPGRILLVGRLHHEKGVDLFIEAISRIVERNPTLSADIAGEGPERSRLEAQSRALGLQDRVRFLGFRRDIPALLSRAAIFCLPSRSEAFPIAVLEAMRARTPVVASAVGGVPEQLANGVGWLAEPSVDGLARSLELAISDPVESESRARRAQAAQSDCFDAKRMVEKYQHVYEQLSGIR